MLLFGMGADEVGEVWVEAVLARERGVAALGIAESLVEVEKKVRGSERRSKTSNTYRKKTTKTRIHSDVM